MCTCSTKEYDVPVYILFRKIKKNSIVVFILLSVMCWEASAFYFNLVAALDLYHANAILFLLLLFFVVNKPRLENRVYPFTFLLVDLS